MQEKRFEKVAANKSNPQYPKLIEREIPLYEHDFLRDEFDRDYTRLLHSSAFRRLKHKTQVFPNVENDHICTRMEHVLHVESASYTIANTLGLSTSLTRAISMGHDIGHAPFGHQGESIISTIKQKYLNERFWHEQNGLYFADQIELLQDPEGDSRNLSLTYAVRDGIISHCGEIDQHCLFPRTSYIDLKDFSYPGEYNSVTWEGCVVKLSDKIAYIGRDIQDAATLNVLSEKAKKEYDLFCKKHHLISLNTSVIMNDVISDVCENSSPDDGLTLSQNCSEFLKEIKELNYEYIYFSDALIPFRKYSEQLINEVFDSLLRLLDEEHPTIVPLEKEKRYPILLGGYLNFIHPYLLSSSDYTQNKKIYENLQTKELFYRSVIDYISGMTDSYLIRCFNELNNF